MAIKKTLVNLYRFLGTYWATWIGSSLIAILARDPYFLAASELSYYSIISFSSYASYQALMFLIAKNEAAPRNRGAENSLQAKHLSFVREPYQFKLL